MEKILFSYILLPFIFGYRNPGSSFSSGEIKDVTILTDPHSLLPDDDWSRTLRPKVTEERGGQVVRGRKGPQRSGHCERQENELPNKLTR